jgi:hypothetical protein
MRTAEQRGGRTIQERRMEVLGNHSSSSRVLLGWFAGALLVGGLAGLVSVAFAGPGQVTVAQQLLQSDGARQSMDVAGETFRELAPVTAATAAEVPRAGQ